MTLNSEIDHLSLFLENKFNQTISTNAKNNKMKNKHNLKLNCNFKQFEAVKPPAIEIKSSPFFKS